MGITRGEKEDDDKSNIPWRLQLRRFCIFPLIDGFPLKRSILILSPGVSQRGMRPNHLSGPRISPRQPANVIPSFANGTDCKVNDAWLTIDVIACLSNTIAR